jgi:quinol monooxygenase YgiN
MNNVLRVIANIIAKPGHENAVRKALELVVPASRLEEGCLRYDLHINNAIPGHFVMFEEWSGADALKLHEHSQHFQALVQSVTAITTIELTKMTQIA